MNLDIAALEYVYVSKRSIIGNVSMAVGLTVGGCVEPWILRALGDWKLLMPILFAQGAIVFITPCFVHESARWLISKGKVEKAAEVLKKIAKTNRRDVSDEVFKNFEVSVEQIYHLVMVNLQGVSGFDRYFTPLLSRY